MFMFIFDRGIFRGNDVNRSNRELSVVSVVNSQESAVSKTILCFEWHVDLVSLLEDPCVLIINRRLCVCFNKQVEMTVYNAHR